ncbi:MAG: ABC transporter permease [Treponema sp.]|nr:ABC transporter permease [Treponema sp.]MCL2272316.1 ABC transporter permease [Treponema sp.]
MNIKLFNEIYAYREMIASLVRKDLRGRYKGSVLGFLWTFLNPLLQLLVYTLVFSVIMRANIEKFYLFLFVALVPWLFFASCLSAGAGVIVNEKNLIVKIHFPREVIPIYFVTSSFINMLYCFVVVIAVVLVSGIQLNIVAFFYLPVIMAVEYIMALGVCFMVSAVTVYFRDLQHIMGILTMAWQFLTPILYPITLVPDELMPIFMLNPMTPVINAYRDILYYGKVPQMFTMIHAAIFGIVILIFGILIFGRLKRRFAEVL